VVVDVRHEEEVFVVGLSRGCGLSTAAVFVAVIFVGTRNVQSG
jgi:hypothetical protein